MISKIEYEITLRFVKRCCKFGFIPGDWDAGRRGMIQTSRKWKNIISPLMLAIHASYFIFIIFVVLMQLLPKADGTILTIVALAPLIRPKNPNFIYSVLPQNWVTLGLCSCLEVWICFNTHTTGNLIFTFIFYYLFTTTFWLDKIKRL